MNEAFITGFLDELEKNAFFGKKELRDLQSKLKEVYRGYTKAPQVEVVPTPGGGSEEKPIESGSVMESAKSMASDVGKRIKSLKPMRRRYASFRQRKPGLVQRVKTWFGRNR